MKIYNKSQRTFVYHDIRIIPQMWSAELPDEAAQKLLATYPHELTAAETQHASTAAAVVLEKKTEEIAQLKSQLSKLQKIVESDDVDSRAGANRKAAKLEIELQEAKNEITSQQKQIVDLTAQIQALKAAPASDSL